MVDNYDKFDLQLDTIWLDIDYTDGKRYFTWDYEAFPKPLDLMRYVKSIGLHLTYIIDPHIKKDPEYFFYGNNSIRDFFVKTPEGADYEGECWPGLSSYVDFLNPSARKYYADQYLMENFADNSVDTGIWNDMNEPAVFEGPEKSMPREMIHYGGWEHRNVHNQYGFLHTKGTYDGVLRRGNNQLRPFILTRAFFSGTQR